MVELFRAAKRRVGGGQEPGVRARVARMVTAAMALVVVSFGLSGAALGFGASLTTRDIAYPTPSISGTVSDSSGALIETEDICVKASLSVGGYAVGDAVTNRVGAYTIAGLNPGQYYLHAYDCGAKNTRNDVATYYTGSGSAPAPVTLTAGQAMTGIDIQMAAATTISGVVYGGSSATMVAGVCVNATPAQSGEGYPGHHTVTASDGSYALDRVAPGVPYVLEFDPGCIGQSRYIAQYWNGVYSRTQATQVTSTLSSPATVSPTLVVGGTVAGTVSAPSGSSIDLSADVCMTAEPATYSGAEALAGFQSAPVAANGSYQITGLPTGTYYVYAYQCGSANGSASFATTYYGMDAQGYPQTVTVTDGAQTSDINVTLDVGSAISGHVYGGSGTTTPVGNVCVSVDYIGGGIPGDPAPYYFYGGFGYGSAVTASDGSYTIPVLAADAAYTVYFDPQCQTGPQNIYATQYYNGASDEGDGAEVVAPATGVDAHLVAAATGTGALSGQVSTYTGVAVGAGAVCVDAIPDGGAAVYQSTRTNASGDYSFSSVVDGQYLIYAYSCGTAAVGSIESTSPVTVSTGQTTTYNITLPQTGTISGTVYGGSGTTNPLVGVCVDATPAGGGSSQYVYTTTGAGGGYELTGLDVGTAYIVSFDPSCGTFSPPYQEQWYASSGSTDNESDATAITATTTAITGIDANLDTGASITGTVYDASGAAITSGDICVSASGQSNGSYGQATTNSSGDYTITGLQAGTYYVEFQDCSGSSRNDVPQYYGGSYNADSSQTVTLSEGGQQQGVDATMQPGTSISGTVYAGAGTTSPLADVCVDVSGSTTGAYGQATTATVGTYTIANLPADSYSVSFYDCSGSGYLTQTYSATVSPTATAPATGIDANMVLGGSISGTVTDQSGNAAAGACVDAYDSSGNFVNSANVQSSGAYTINGLPAGSYTVTATDCGSEFQSFTNDIGETSSAVQVSAPGMASGVDLVLAPATSISGRALTGPAGSRQVLGGICVTVENTGGSPVLLADGSYASAYTSYQNGGYTVTGLPAGSYIVQFSDCQSSGSGQYLTTYYDSSYSAGATTAAQATVLSPTVSDPSTGVDAVLGSAPVATITSGPEPNAATNATSATIVFTSDTAGSSFECSLNGSALSTCSSPFATGTLSPGTQTFEVEAIAGSVTQPQPTELSWTVSSSSTTTSTSGTVSPGGTFSTDPGGTPTSSNPVIVAVTAPDIPALADGATVTEQTNLTASTASPNGYQIFGSQMQISVTAAGGGPDVTAPASTPIALSFQILASQIPAGVSYQDVTVTRNGVALTPCTATNGSATPDPCVGSVTETGSGSSAVVTLTVLTTECSTWNFADVLIPTVTGVSPSSGVAGSTVTITGTNLTGTSSVSFGSLSATGVTVVSSTELTAKAPDGSGTVNVTVTTGGGKSQTSAADGYSFKPAVTGLSESSGHVGDTLTIAGTDLAGATSVTFDGGPATTPTSASQDSVVVTIPSGAQSGNVQVTTPDGTSAAVAADELTIEASASGPGSSGSGSSGSGSGSTGTSTAPPAPAPRTPPLAPASAPILRLVAVRAVGALSKVEVRCIAAAGSTCTGTVLLTTVEKLRRRIGHSKRVKLIRRVVVVARARLRLVAGSTRLLSIALDGTGRSLMARVPSLHVMLKLTAPRVISTRHLTLHRPTAKKKRKKKPRR